MHSRAFSLLPLSLLPLLLLSLTAVSAVHGASLNLLQNCPANVSISGAKESERVHNTEVHGNSTSNYLYTYVHPEQGFKGVSLVAKVGRWKNYTAWFPLDNNCFPYDTVLWWRMGAAVYVRTHANNNEYLEFQLWTGNCNAVCEKNIQAHGAVSLQVMAHGPSSWRHEDPTEYCSPRGELTKNFQTYTCTERPPQKTTTPHSTHSTTPATLPTQNLDTTLASNTDPVISTPANEAEDTTPFWAIIVPVMVVVVLVVVVVVVVMVRRNRQRGKTTEEDAVMRRCQAAPSSEQVVVENNLYEPFDNFQGPPPSSEQVVVENNLYEPFDNFQGPPPSSEQVVVENNLYEPFDNFQHAQPRDK